MIGEIKTIVVIDPISSGRFYGQAIRTKGYCALALVTQKKLSGRLQKLYGVETFDKVFFVEDFEDACRQLQEARVCAVIPGSDSALPLCDRLADHFKVLGNPTQTSSARIDKFTMKCYLEAAGVQAVSAYLLSKDDFAKAPGPEISFPVVVKPRYGTGAQNVKVCESRNEVYNAFLDIENSVYANSSCEQVALFEPFVEGVEQFIVTANLGGSRRQILCFAQYQKIRVGQNPSVYRTIRSLSPDSTSAKQAFAYVKEANSALQADVGINDVEFKANSEGYYFIEQNGRLPGANVPNLIELCTGLDCYSLNIDIYLGHASDKISKPVYTKHFCICCLISDRTGYVSGVEGVALVEELESFHEICIFVEDDELIGATENFLSSWGVVYLIHEDSSRLQRESEIVHEKLKLKFK